MFDFEQKSNYAIFCQIISLISLSILLNRTALGLAALLDFRRRAQGKITFIELGRRLDFQESEHLEGSYLGYATKRIGEWIGSHPKE